MMMMNKEDLLKKTRDDLKKIADDLGIDVGRVGAKKIVERILAATGGEVPEENSGAAPQLEDVKPKTDNHTAKQNFKALTPLQKISRDNPTVAELKKALEPYVERGLHINSIDEEFWHFSRKGREDSGTINQPLQNVIKCVRLLMKK